MKAKYHPPMFFGLTLAKAFGFRTAEASEEVEVIGQDFEHVTVTIRVPVAPSSIINMARRQRGLEPITTMVRDVPRQTVTFDRTQE